MNDLGLLSVYAANSAFSTDSVYVHGSSSVKDKQPGSAEKNSTAQAETDINDEAIISDAAKNLLATEQTDNQNQTTTKDKDDSDLPQTDLNNESQETKTPELPAKKTEKSEEDSDNGVSKEEEQKTLQNNEELTQAEKQQVAKLQAADTEVKAHEQAHLAASGGLNASAPSYEYQTGPDGKKYAVAGEVNVSASESSNPEANLKNAEQLKRAALAPANPSAQDKAVARHADQMIMQAQQEIAAENQAKIKETHQPDVTTDTSDASESTSKPGTNDAIGTVAEGDATALKINPQEPLKNTIRQVQQQNPLDNTTLTTIIYAG